MEEKVENKVIERESEKKKVRVRGKSAERRKTGEH